LSLKEREQKNIRALIWADLDQGVERYMHQGKVLRATQAGWSHSLGAEYIRLRHLQHHTPFFILAMIKEGVCDIDGTEWWSITSLFGLLFYR